MPTFKFEAMDTTGGEVKDSVDAASEEEAQQKIRNIDIMKTIWRDMGVPGSGTDERTTGVGSGRRGGKSQLVTLFVHRRIP